MYCVIYASLEYVIHVFGSSRSLLGLIRTSETIGVFSNHSRLFHGHMRRSAITLLSAPKLLVFGRATRLSNFAKMSSGGSANNATGSWKSSISEKGAFVRKQSAFRNAVTGETNCMSLLCLDLPRRHSFEITLSVTFDVHRLYYIVLATGLK